MTETGPLPTMAQIEEELGFKASDIGCPCLEEDKHASRLYSDLWPVECDPEELMLREWQEYKRSGSFSSGLSVFPDQDLLTVGNVKFIKTGDCTIRLQCRSGIGLYRFLVDVEYRFGLELSMLFSCDEVHTLLVISQLQRNPPTSTLNPAPSRLLNLPPELRGLIYHFTLDTADVTVRLPLTKNSKQGSLSSIVQGIGDPSGFFMRFPTRVPIQPLLLLNKQIRTEALPIVFQTAHFEAHDIDSLVIFLLSIGEIGRSNIRSISCAWESESEMEALWHLEGFLDNFCPRLPKWNVTKAGCLLRQCQKLRYLCLTIDENGFCYLSLDAFKADSSVTELRSLHHIDEIEILDILDSQPLEHNDLIKWLKTELQNNAK